MQTNYYKIYVNDGYGYEFNRYATPTNVNEKINNLLEEHYKVIATGWDIRLNSTSDLIYKCNSKNFKPMKRDRRNIKKKQI
jgi:hypothetical protein